MVRIIKLKDYSIKDIELNIPNNEAGLLILQSKKAGIMIAKDMDTISAQDLFNTLGKYKKRIEKVRKRKEERELQRYIASLYLGKTKKLQYFLRGTGLGLDMFKIRGETSKVLYWTIRNREEFIFRKFEDSMKIVEDIDKFIKKINLYGSSHIHIGDDFITLFYSLHIEDKKELKGREKIKGSIIKE